MEIKELICLRCGYRWLPRVKIVKQCPKCKSYQYNKPKREG